MTATTNHLKARMSLATVMDCIEADTAKSAADLHDLKALLDSAARHAAGDVDLLGHVVGVRKLFASYCRVWARERMEAA